MNVEFDDAKDVANLAKDGLSLAEAAEFDFAAALVVVDGRFDYGETSYRAYAATQGRGRCLVFAIVGETIIRAINLRRTRPKEMRRYGL